MRKFFLDNLVLKIAAVLLSVALWFFATSRGQSEISIDVPLVFRNIPSGLEMIDNNIKTISLNIKGQERPIKNIKLSDIVIYIDLSKAKKGKSIYYVTRDNIKLPHSLTVLNINPSSVKVIIEDTITKTVKVRPVITGEPEKGYYVKSVEVAPEIVVIEGVSSEVRRFNTIKTEALDITGSNETFTQELKLDLTGKNIRAKINVIKVKVVIGGKRK
jgi:YbbR domain-containing protein